MQVRLLLPGLASAAGSLLFGSIDAGSRPLQEQPWLVGGLILSALLIVTISLLAMRAYRKLARQTSQMRDMPQPNFRQVVDTAQEGIATIDADGICTMLNEEFAIILGYPREHFLHRHYRDWVGPEMAGEADRLFHRKQLGLIDHYELQVATHQGTRLVAACERPIPTVNGSFTGYLLTIADLTARKRGEDAIRQSEVNYRMLFNSSPNALLLVDLQSLAILHVNDAACECYGYSHEEFSRLSILDLQVAEGADLSRRMFDAPVQPGPVLHRHLRQNGSAIDVEVYAHDQIFQGKPCRQILTLDKTEQVLAANLLKESAEMLALAQKIAQMGSFRLRVYGSRVATPEWSDEMYRLLGLDPQNKPASTPLHHEFIHALDLPAFEERWQRLINDSVPFEFEHRIVRVDLSIRYVRTAAQLAEADQGLLIGTIQDITDYNAIQQQLERSHRLDSVGRLAGGVAHDFNNLLTVINGYSKLILRRLEPDTRLYGDIQQIAEAGAEAADLTKRLLAFGRKQTLKPVTLDLNLVVTEAKSLLVGLIGEDIRLVTRFSRTPISIQADPVQINQVLLNLATNARDAMPRGGTLTIETSYVVLDQDFVELHPAANLGPHARLLVADTGIGISPEIQKSIFEPFFTTKDRTGGTGLGLATVYGIIQQTGGSIYLDSAPGAGSRFNIFLPALCPAEMATTPCELLHTILDTPPKGGNRLIVLVEDQADVRRFVTGVLIENGYRVLQAANGEEALAILDRLCETPDLLLTDVVMPGITGFELVQHIAARRPGAAMKVIYMSGYADGKLDAAGAPVSGVTLLEKPFSAEELLRQVGQTVFGQKIIA